MKKILFLTVFFLSGSHLFFSESDERTNHEKNKYETCSEILTNIRSCMLCLGERLSGHNDKNCKENIVFWTDLYIMLCKEENKK